MWGFLVVRLKSVVGTCQNIKPGSAPGFLMSANLESGRWPSAGLSGSSCSARRCTLHETSLRVDQKNQWIHVYLWHGSHACRPGAS